MSPIMKTRRAGFTLAEIIIGTAAAVVIFGSAAGIYIVSSKTAQRSIRQDQVFSDAVAAVQEIERELKKVESGDAVNVASDFSSEKGVDSLGHNRDKVDISVTFKYAVDFDGLAPKWVNELPAGQSPRLVGYEVVSELNEKAQMKDAPIAAVRLTGAVSMVD